MYYVLYTTGMKVVKLEHTNIINHSKVGMTKNFEKPKAYHLPGNFCGNTVVSNIVEATCCQ